MLPDRAELERLYAYPTTPDPWVRTNFVATLDGAAHTADGVSGGLGGPADTAVFAILRSLADVVLVGAGTARAEGYGVAAEAPIAVVSRSLEIPDALVAPGQLVITTADAPADRVAELRRTVDVVAHGQGEIDWHAVLTDLGGRGLTRILCEGGPSLHGRLVELDLVDEVCLTVAPVLSGGRAPRIAVGEHPADRPMRLGHVLEAEGALLTRWERDRS